MFTWDAVQSELQGAVPSTESSDYINYWTDLTGVVTRLLARNIYVILCPWQYNASSNDTDIVYQGESFSATDFAEFWAKFSSAVNVITGDDQRVAFDLINEPHTHEESGEVPVDLIIMPTHGCWTFRAALLGSVTEKVIHDTRCPVWTSVHTEKIHNPVYPYRLLVCAIDELESSIPVIRKAGEIAAAFESSLVLARAVRSSEKRTESEIRLRLEQLEWSGEVSVPICIEAGDIVDVVTRTAARQGADLIITGRGRSTEVLGLIRSHVFGIIRESHCPVLTV